MSDPTAAIRARVAEEREHVPGPRSVRDREFHTAMCNLADALLAILDDACEPREGQDWHGHAVIDGEALRGALATAWGVGSEPDIRSKAHSLTDCWCGMPHRREDFL